MQNISFARFEIRRGAEAYLEFVLEEVFLGWHFAVETEESLLIGAEGLFNRLLEWFRKW